MNVGTTRNGGIDLLINQSLMVLGKSKALLDHNEALRKKSLRLRKRSMSLVDRFRSPANQTDTWRQSPGSDVRSWNHRAAYNGKTLRYSSNVRELLINVADLCSILGIEAAAAEITDLRSSIQLAQAYDRNLAIWLLDTFEEYLPADLPGSIRWLYSPTLPLF